MQEKSSLIMITVNQGFTDDVMATARKAGARGGTVVRGRWVAKEEVERLEGVTRQDEKEILLIVVPREVRNSVMEAVNANHGLQSEAGAVICSLGVEQIAPGGSPGPRGGPPPARGGAGPPAFCHAAWTGDGPHGRNFMCAHVCLLSRRAHGA